MRLSVGIAVLLLLVTGTLTEGPAAMAASPSHSSVVAEDFITVLERKAIDRYLKRRGVDRATRRRLLDPHDALDFELEEHHGHGRKAFKKKRTHKGLPPGLAKRNRLPPGLAKRSDLPPGLAKRDLPDDLTYLLPKRAKGRRLYEINGDIVLVDLATDIVLDVIEGVLLGDSASF